jgi:purine-binding chemotaxis protein CheW
VSAMHVHLRVGAERYAVPVADVRSIVDLEGVAPVLGMPPAVLGLRALDGALLPVFDLATLLGVAGAAPTRVVVVDAASPLGLAVDAVLDVAELPPLEAADDGGRLRGTALLDGTLLGAIDLPTVLGELEAVMAA